MSKTLQEKAFEAVKYSRELGIGYLTTKENYFNGKKIETDNGSFSIFSLCDYLKIMPDERIKAAAIQAVKNHGINFAVSRSYYKLHLYEEAEQVLASVFGKPVTLFARTALAHIGTLPVLIKKKDAIILDQQVHATIQSGAEIVKARGTYVEIIRHSRLDILEERIKKLKDKYNIVWYLADGVYSMFGDKFPIEKMRNLLDKYPQLRLYIDDAHGMSWYGKNGQGFVLSKMGYHPQMILTTSLGKGFGAGGGAVICPDIETKEKIIYAGGPLMFSSPIEPSMLGALITSSKIHLSNEIYKKQNAINELMHYFYEKVKISNLPLISDDLTPLSYFASGKNEEIYFLIDYLQKNGIATTAGIFPAVSYNNTGVRIQISLYQEKSDIDHLIDVLQNGYRLIEKERGISIENILRFFKH